MNTSGRSSGGRFFGQTVSERREAILHSRPSGVLLKLSIPTLMMAVVQSLIPLSDGLFLNNAAGYIVAGAVGVSVTVINMLNALSQGLASAGMAMIGQLNGRGDLAAVRKTALQILMFGATCGLAIGLLMLPLSRVVGPLLGAKTELCDAIAAYLGLYSGVIPFVFMAALFNAIKNATGQPEQTFYRMVLLLLLKSGFNWFFLFWLRLGVVGAALASLCAYAVVGLWMVYDLFIRPGEIRLSIRGFRFDRQVIGLLIRLGIPTMLSFFMVYLGFFLIDREVVRYGEIALTGQTISGNINAMAFTVPSSIATTVTTMVSINIAAGQEGNARRSYYSGLVLSLILAVVIVAVFVPLAPHMVWMFLNNPEMSVATRQAIADVAIPSLNIYTVSVIGFAVFMVAQGADIGLGKTRVPLVMSVLRIWLFRYLFIVLFRGVLGLFSVFWGNLVSNYLAAVVITVALLRSDWNRHLIHDAREMGEQRP